MYSDPDALAAAMNELTLSGRVARFEGVYIPGTPGPARQNAGSAGAGAVAVVPASAAGANAIGGAGASGVSGDWVQNWIASNPDAAGAQVQLTQDVVNAIPGGSAIEGTIGNIIDAGVSAVLRPILEPIGAMVGAGATLVMVAGAILLGLFVVVIILSFATGKLMS